MTLSQDIRAEDRQGSNPAAAAGGDDSSTSAVSWSRRGSLLSFESQSDSSEPQQPPAMLQTVAPPGSRLRRVYEINHEWKSVTVKALINIYMGTIAYIFAGDCSPWYSYFKYLTIWGWTLVQVYFLYTLYLDLMGRWNRPEGISQVATAFAQAMSELAFAVQVVVTSFFWFWIYPLEPWRNIAWEINMHGVGLILMIFDYLYRFAGFNLRNLKFVYAFAGFYTAIHLFSVWASGEPIYPGMDFTNTYSFVVFLSGLTTVVMTHKIFYLFHNWSRLRQEWKTIVGISAFFLIPRKDSIEVLMGPEECLLLEREVAAAGSRESTITALPIPVPRLRRDDNRNTSVVKSRKHPGLVRRLRRFTVNEVLSVSPSVQARSQIKALKRDHK